MRKVIIFIIYIAFTLSSQGAIKIDADSAYVRGDYAQAIALYEGHSVWITDEIIEEMIEMSKEMKVSEIAEIYRLDPHQVRFYLKRAGAFVPHRKFSNKEKTNDKN